MSKQQNKSGRIVSFPLSAFAIPEKRYQVEGEFFVGWEMIKSFDTLDSAKDLIISIKSKFPFEFRIMDNETGERVSL